MCNIPCELCGDADECDLYKSIIQLLNNSSIKREDLYEKKNQIRILQ